MSRADVDPEARFLPSPAAPILNEHDVRELRPMRLAKSAALGIGVAEFADELRRLPAAELSWIQQQLKVRTGASTSVLAQSLRTRLVRAPEGLAELILTDALRFGVVNTALTCCLSDEELAAVLRADASALAFLSTHDLLPLLLDAGSFGYTPALRAGVWSVMVATAHVGAVAALGWLVAEPPPGWSPDTLAAVRATWARLRQRHQLLPAQPEPLGRLVDVVTELQRGQAAAAESALPDEITAERPDDGVDVARAPAAWGNGTHGQEVSPEDVGDLAALCDVVTDALGEIRADVLPGLVDALDAGRLPAEGDLARVGRFVDNLNALFEKVAVVTQEPAPQTLDEARLRLDELSAAMDSLGHVARVRRLTSLRAPEYMAGEARQVAELAASVDAGTDPAVLAGLDALLTAIEIGGRDPQRVTELARTAQRDLPVASLLIMLAASGGLSLADDDAAAPDEASAPDGVLTPDAATTPDDVTTPDAAVPEDAAVADTGAADSGTSHLAGPAGTDVRSAAGTPAKVPAPRPAAETAALLAVAAAPAASASLEEVLAGLRLTVPVPVGGPAGEVTAADDAGDTGAPPDAESLHVRLLAEGRFVLAAWLMEAQEAPAAVVAAHRLAAHAMAMRSSAGSNAAAFADTARQLDAEALGDRPDMQMLVYAASVRAGLLSPTAGAAGPLRDVIPSINKAGAAVEELTEALLNAIYSGAYLTARSTDAVAEAAGAEAEHAALTGAARDMLLSGPSRTIRYAAATELWQLWMAAGGFLGAPLTIVASGSRGLDDLAVVRERVRELRSKSDLEAALDQDTRRSSSVKRRQRIEAKARGKILEWTADVTDLLTKWVEATENLTRPPAAGTWMADPMAELRSRVNGVREQALEQLAAFAHNGQPARDAAASAGLALLTESLELLDGKTALRGAELAADRLVHGQLALAPQLPIAPSLQPSRPPTVHDIAAAMDALDDGEAGWNRAFAQRAARHDQVGTQILIDVLRADDPQLAQRLSAARDRAVAASAERLDQEAGGAATRIDADRRYGRLSADDWADLSAQIREYTSGARGTRRDYDAMLTDVDQIEQDRAAKVGVAVAAARKQLREAGAEVPEAAAARITSRIDDGDLTTANEYLETVRSGRELPGPHDDVDHLRLFHPSFPALFADSTGNAPITALLAELRRAIDEGRNPSSGPLAQALADARIDVSQIRARGAASSIGQWTALAQEKSLDAKVGGVKQVLERLGFVVEGANTPPTGRRGQTYGRSYWMHLTGVRATAGNALIPAFGSAISPSGNTLRVLAVWRSPTASELIELLRSEQTDHSVLVLYFGTLDVNARRELATEFRGGSGGRRLPVTAVIDEAAFAYLVAQPEPSRDTTMAISLPFTSATPFTPDVAGLVPQEMFYGRAEERDKVVDMMGSCIVYGGRQLGKSALLRAAAREFDDNVSRHAVYLSIYQVGQAVPADAVWSTLWPSLADKGIVSREMPAGELAPALMSQVAAWIAAQPGRQLLLLLDESDFFLDADAAEGRFTNVTQFKELMERTMRSVKVVFAGLHQTARFERLVNHPLAHFGDPVCVGPLAPQAAYDLLTKPLHALGYRFGDQDHAPRVLALSNNQPALIQLFGAQLLRNLQRVPLAADAPPQNVTDGDVETVWADDSLRTAFRKRFDWTLNLDLRYKVIAYSVAFHAHANGAGSALPAAALRAECEQWWPQGFAAENVRSGEFRALLDECVDLGVLSYANGRYRLRTPNVLDLLGSREEVDEFLDQAHSMPLPQSFDGSLLRPPFGTGPTRGPLTSQQIADLLSPRSQVRMIAGSAALTVERCMRAMRDEHDTITGVRRSQLREANPTNIAHECQQATMLAAGGHAVVVVDLKTATPQVARTTWRTARELIAAHSGGTLGVVLVTSPKQAAVWPTVADESDASSGLTGLRRYEETDLRLWLTETTLPFQDDASRNELLTMTGGWPMNVNKVAEDLSRDQDGDARVDPLGGLRLHLSDPARADDLVAASGARADEVLHEAWRFLVRELADEQADPQEVAEYLSMHAESEDPAAAVLRDAGLVALGYRGLGDVVDVLRTLGLLVASAEDGKLLVEPVMAAATRAAAR